eukprot:CAMPEP_0172379688 /NCGR_PEP_ID=MMETSP1060-20121228/70059_1 /TAXON_ID=37318 /ORGANISM="Pseudo-nitzschia pungens, Strain cf. cingulata" /LENGTH=225 /DNA_ID=CAMNT_0013107433 /DNA_START=148 /DNA_END=822 /DNA_ORIENTATION=+
MKAVRRITPEKMLRFLQAFNANCHPMCPNPDLVFAGLGFDQAFETFAEWMRYQPLIGIKPTASTWLAGLGFDQAFETFAEWMRYQPLIGIKPMASTWLSDPLASKRTQARLNEMATAERDPASGPTTLPKLINLENFRRWEQAFCQFLRFCYNEQGFPLSYVIRLNNQQEVTATERSGTVGKNWTFPSWMEYNVRCAALEGPQFTTNNHAVWVLLCNAVQDGPAW